VDCLLPGQVRQLGRHNTYISPRRPVKTTASDCEIRGGEYVSYDRADYRTALKVWKEQAEEGDPKAQTYVGEIFEKGLGIAPDHAMAAEWYEKAALQDYTPAQLALGNLYEKGLGVPRDAAKALEWFRKASGLRELGVSYVTAPESAGARAEAEKEEAVARPTIQLIEPPLPETRGLKVPSGKLSSTPTGEHPVVGRVEAPAGLRELRVDGNPQPVDTKGLFRAMVQVPASGREVRIVAIDRLDRESVRIFRLAPSGEWTGPAAEKPAASPGFGEFHALVIGNQAYAHLPSLTTAYADADRVAAVLSDRYGFRVTLLRDATRYDILSALNRLRGELDENDNLLVYYAGHGDLDQSNMRGYWLPVDAERDSNANWISNTAITDVLNTMSALHVLVISDSCYSGSLTRSALAQLDPGMSDEARSTWVRAMASKRSRTALTSGGLAPVLDQGGGAHSVFARALLEVLEQNQGVLEGQRLYRELSARVTYAAEQYPRSRCWRSMPRVTSPVAARPAARAASCLAASATPPSSAQASMSTTKSARPARPASART
jgi:hypothetical protein